ncbi:uncharacterized protein LOC100182555 isoform X3 [Ciona intestinalis]
MNCLFLQVFVTGFVICYSAPPAFKSTPPPSTVARVRESLLLQCRVVGKPPPDVTWRKDGWLLQNGENGIKINGGKLLVRSLTTSHRGNYECQGRNPQGQVEHTTSVFVQAPPEITVSPKDLEAKEEQDAFFYCKAEGYPVDISYSWFFNGLEVGSLPQLRGRFRTFNDGTFEIESVSKEDSGNISCEAANDFGIAPRVTARLVVQYAAQVVDMPSINFAGISLPLILRCPSIAEPEVSSVTWRKNGNSVGSGNNGGDRVHVSISGELIFKAIQQSDEGLYSCTPYNILGTGGESPKMRLVVKNPPQFIAKPETQYELEIGKPFIASCYGNGDPPTTVTWRKVESDHDYFNGDRVSRNHSSLFITSVSKSDNGIWQCVLSNAVANVTANTTINVKYTTPHAASEVTVVTSSSNATVKWMPGYDGGYPQHFMIWYKKAEQGDHTWSTSYVEGGRKVATVSRLEPATVYQFSLLSENVLGSGPFSRTVTKKTKVITKNRSLASVTHVAIPPPRDLQYYIESEIIVLSWKPPALPPSISLLGFLVEFQKQKNNPDEAAPLDKSIKNRSKETMSNARLRRNSISSPVIVKGQLTESDSNAWTILNAVAANMTSYGIPAGSLVQNAIYRFRVLSVTSESYGFPSQYVTVSTEGLSVYLPASPIGNYASSYTANAGLISGIITGSIFIFVTIAIAVGYWHHRHGATSALQQTSYIKEDAVESFLTNRKEDQDFAKSGNYKYDLSTPESSVLYTKERREEKINDGVLWKIKKKIEKNKKRSDDLKVEQYFEKNKKVKRSKSLSQHGKETSQLTSIQRSLDGKFHVSNVRKSDESPSYSSDHPNQVTWRKAERSGRKMRPISDSYLSRNPPKMFEVEESIMEEEGTLEIDCSRSNIEVRYLRDDAQRFSTRKWEPHFNYPASMGGTLPLMNSTVKSYEPALNLPRHLSPRADVSLHSTDSHLSCPAAEYVYLRDISSDTATDSVTKRISSTSHIMFPRLRPTSTASLNLKYHTTKPVSSKHPRHNKVSRLNETNKRHSSTKSLGTRQVNQQLIVNNANDLATCINRNMQSTQQPLITTNYFTSQPSMTTNNNKMTSEKQKHLRRSSYSTSLPTLNPLVKQSKTKKDVFLFRRSISEETLGLLVSDNDSDQRISFTSGSASTVRQQNSRENIADAQPICKTNNFLHGDKHQKGISMSDSAHHSFKQSPPEMGSSSGYDSLNCSSSDASHRNSFMYDENYHHHEKTSHSHHHHYPEILNRCFNRVPPHAQNHSPLHKCNAAFDIIHKSVNIRDRSDARCSNASSLELRCRKDTSSVDEKYEWDSEYAMESEIIEAMRNFESLKSTGKVSKDLQLELQKFGIAQDENLQLDNSHSEEASSNIVSQNDLDWDSPSPDDVTYTKASIEKRCAALKEEYMEYQRRKNSDIDVTGQNEDY